MIEKLDGVHERAQNQLGLFVLDLFFDHFRTTKGNRVAGDVLLWLLDRNDAISLENVQLNLFQGENYAGDTLDLVPCYIGGLDSQLDEVSHLFLLLHSGK